MSHFTSLPMPHYGFFTNRVLFMYKCCWGVEIRTTQNVCSWWWEQNLRWISTGWGFINGYCYPLHHWTFASLDTIDDKSHFVHAHHCSNNEILLYFSDWYQQYHTSLHFRLIFVMFFFFKVKSIRLVGILLMVFIEKKHLSFVKDVYAESVATGIMGLMVWSTIL